MYLMHSSMAISKMRYICNNLQTMWILITLIMFVSCTNFFMVSNKHQGLGLRDLPFTYFILASLHQWQIAPYSFSAQPIQLYIFCCMLMISLLLGMIQLRLHILQLLLVRFLSLRTQALLITSWGFKLLKLPMVLLLLNPNMPLICFTGFIWRTPKLLRPLVVLPQDWCLMMVLLFETLLSIGAWLMLFST